MSHSRLRAGIAGVLAIALFVSLSSSSLRDVSGYPTGLAVVPFSAAIALLLSGAAALGGATVAGAWAGLSLASFGAYLQLIDAGTIGFMRKLDVKEIHGYNGARGLKLLKL